MCALVTGFQTCALPISYVPGQRVDASALQTLPALGNSTDLPYAPIGSELMDPRSTLQALPVKSLSFQGQSRMERVRSEEGRVGKESVSTCRSRGSPYH